jgi:hypothetical protein
MSEVTYTYVPAETSRFSAITATVDGNVVGKVTWHTRARYIASYEVDGSHRRHGIAIGMWDWMLEHVPAAEQPKEPRSDKGLTPAAQGLFHAYMQRNGREAAPGSAE